MSVSDKINDIWLKAGVVGSLWASIEIVIGSFLHNMQLPMSGTMLSMTGVLILVAFHQLWSEKGLFWRAGLICALMKSIAPSAFLIGPMIGIFLQALLMEGAISVLGKNYAGYLIGGAAAVAINLLLKVINMLVKYGFDVVVVLINFYKFSIQQIGMENLKVWQAVSILFALYFLLGSFSAVAGIVIARNVKKRRVTLLPDYSTEIKPEILTFNRQCNVKHSIAALIFHLVAIVLCFIVLNVLPLIQAVVIIGIYVIASVLRYQRTMNHLKKPLLWVQVFIITLLATLFFNGFQTGNPFDHDGLMVGLKMNVRAILVIAGFSAIGAELKNPVVKAVLAKNGLSQLYMVLGASFSVLPVLIGQLARPAVLIKSPVRTLANLLHRAENLLDYFRKNSGCPGILIITGEKHQGKTTFLDELIRLLRLKGFTTGGIIAPGQFENDQRVSFTIVDIKTGDSMPLCSVHFTEGEKIGPFTFSASAFTFGYKALEYNHLKGCDFVAIDEIGLLELQDKGWAKAIIPLLDKSDFEYLWVVRKSLVDVVIRKFGLREVKLVDIGLVSPDQVADWLIKK
ncbi:MAG TPA: nucleoside-triphosphatase [Bacteroidales bacterium]|nr:nucleoside-triphosphatase [Bacteroidales bacterium]HRW96601.1 nucleoside-triphosphatase [Bacteroidales bacterium]